MRANHRIQRKNTGLLKCGLLFYFLLTFTTKGGTQTPLVTISPSDTLPPFRIVCWNVENLFDIHHDTLKEDREFLPTSLRHWNYQRYQKKLADIACVIVATGGWTAPALIGLCEVENDQVLKDLTRFSPLKNLGYQYTMTHSPDIRGINVALLYQPGDFKLVSYQSIPVGMPPGQVRPTRDILHVCGVIPTKDSLDVFVCHFPSRAGGAKASEPYRLWVARKLRSLADSIFDTRTHPQVIIMGDFNDSPFDKAITDILEAVAPPTSHPSPDRLYHLLARKAKSTEKSASYKYHGKWELLDHLIVSGTLLRPAGKFYTDERHAGVVRHPFLLEEDKVYGGVQPFRTYKGMKYQGGISDHLPVYVDFMMKRQK